MQKIAAGFGLFLLGGIIGVWGCLLMNPSTPTEQIANVALDKLVRGESQVIGKMLEDIRYYREQGRGLAHKIEYRKGTVKAISKDIQEVVHQEFEAQVAVAESRVKESKAAEKVGPVDENDPPELQACKAWGQTLTEGITAREDRIKGLQWLNVQLDLKAKNQHTIIEDQTDLLQLADLTINRLEKQLNGMKRNRLRFGPGVSIGIGRSFDGRWSPQATVGVALIWGK